MPGPLIESGAAVSDVDAIPRPACMPGPSQTPWVPFHLPSIGEDEIAAVVETLRSGWLTTGARVQQFESDFADFVGARHAVAVNSCTAALHLALEAVGVRRDDEVIIPTLTFAATGEVVTYLNARPVLVDSEAETLNLDPDQVERAITPRTRAIIPVHFGGQPCDMSRLVAIAARHGLSLVEDAAHALPAAVEGRTIGTIADVTCFSFYATKTITTGEGGMMTTARAELADRMRMMSLHGLSRDAWNRYTASGSWRYEILEAGYKYNLTDIAAALGVVQLKRCLEFRDARRRLATRYDEGLRDVRAVRRPREAAGREHAWHLYVIQLELEQLTITRDEFFDELRALGIGASIHFIPLHQHAYYRDVLGWKAASFPVADAAFERIISLPIFPRMSDRDVDRVIDAVGTTAAKYRR